MDTANAVHTADALFFSQSEESNQGEDFSYVRYHLPATVKSMEGHVWKPPGQANPQLCEETEIDRIYDRGTNLQDVSYSRLSSIQGQKLSLTLGSHQSKGDQDLSINNLSPSYTVLRGVPKCLWRSPMVEDAGGDFPVLPSPRCAWNSHNSMWSSKYLKPAQELLNEFACAARATGSGSEQLPKINRFTELTDQTAMRSFHQESTNPRDRNSICYNLCLSEEESVSNRTKSLHVLLDELDTRYEKYCRQIEEVISSFEIVAGVGAAKSYIVLISQEMSRHFSSLRDTIITQINASRDPVFEDSSRKNLSTSHQPSLSNQKGNQKIRLQRLGTIQGQKVWRPLRGLPESSVTVLRAWLFEHFLHPYPSDDEKHMLSSRTGLTRNQISNWFINARVRLWKPMIEEMYREEFAEDSDDSKPSS
ncbi:unnamed protein product [Spirodela intermedia]|uniref:Homeobox domain-containing protein n=1 Tax=Spirodela intermedia TaxID=51605 RepID=A0A7I8IMF3_SPIIN|nr:unnamed protein product [Spirodela intermedia]CAA6658939.1 unnamed protein product [Spirodela intermedia]